MHRAPRRPEHPPCRLLDPDEGIAGTDIVRVTVDDDVTVSDSFKITRALPVRSPGGGDAPDIVGADPTFVFGGDASEDFIDVEVFDAFGELYWSTRLDGIPGQNDVSVRYAGPPLEDGMVYQFRATTIRAGSPISTTEDLKGVFIVDLSL
jgi:hypothetical protein